MPVRRRLTDKGVAALKPRGARYNHADPECCGLYVRITERGAKSYAAVARGPGGKQIWTTLGRCDHLPIEEARVRARDAILRVKDGLPAVEPPAECFQEVAETWLRRHVAAKGLRSAGEIERTLRVYVFPAWGNRPFKSIRRGDVARLLDNLEDRHGARTADLAVGHVRAIANWYAARNDGYASPFVRGMRRHAGGGRERILTDDELRAVWTAAEADQGPFGAIVRLCLLTGQRRDKVESMKWADVSIDGLWTITADAREKGNAGSLPLPPVAVEVLRAQPRTGDNPHVFAGRSIGHYEIHSRAKRGFDEACGVTGWTIHDLRRTARSLMSRAGVRPDIAERVLGHAIGGVEGIYDRHTYEAEKGEALAKLAGLVENIVRPQDNVTPIRVGCEDHAETS